MSNGGADEFKAARLALNTRDDLYSKGWYHSIVLPDGRVMRGTQPLERLQRRLGALPIPKDLRGKRVLDIGAWDGFFSFEMEKRGAEVMAVDLVEIENFRYAKRKLGSKVEYRVMDIFDLTPERVGRFDIVLCLGVIYHLKHPLMALERVCDLTTDMAIIESWVVDDIEGHTQYPWMEFYEADELGGQADNWTGPNMECLYAFLRTAGFARIELAEHTTDHRAAVACYRRWDPLPANLPERAPELQLLLHSQNNGINVSSNKDDYLSAWFVTDEVAFDRQDVFPEVAGYGAHPIFLMPAGERRWQINFKVPPGLEPGWQPVRVRTARSPFSNEIRIPVDVPVAVDELFLRGACDGMDWNPKAVSMSHGVVSLWVRGLPANADLNNVRVYLGDARLSVEFIAPDPDDENSRQVNARLPRTIEPGSGELVVRMGEVESNAIPFSVVEG